MEKISFVIITYNEERNITRCLDSIVNIADEIIVVDSFSTDATEKLCGLYPLIFSKHQFEGHIQQKNYALSLARYNLVFSLDADEVVSEKLQNEILRIKESRNVDAYEFNRLNNYCGQWIRHGAWYPDRKVRLFDRTKGSWQGTNPHDRFVMTKEVKIKKLKGDLLHFTIESIAAHVDQINKFSTIKAEGLYKKGKKASLLGLVFKPPFKFLRSYFFKLGLLDGFNGFIIAYNSAWSDFLKIAKLRELHAKTKQ